jgi:hypothetical protein
VWQLSRYYYYFFSRLPILFLVESLDMVDAHHIVKKMVKLENIYIYTLYFCNEESRMNASLSSKKFVAQSLCFSVIASLS